MTQRHSRFAVNTGTLHAGSVIRRSASRGPPLTASGATGVISNPQLRSTIPWQAFQPGARIATMNRLPPGFRHLITTTPIFRPGESMRRSPAQRVTPGIDSVGPASNVCRAIFANIPQPPIPNIRRQNSTPIVRHVIGLSPGNPHHCFRMTNGSPSVREAITVPAGGIRVPTAM
jgi:hypothetical protein